MPKDQKKSYYWLYTINNPEPNDKTMQTRMHGMYEYLVYQMEKGEQGTLHYQGYVVFTSEKRLSTVRTYQPRAHWEMRKGSHEEAKAYCMKEDTRVLGPWSFGDDSKLPISRGQRNDIYKVKDDIINGQSIYNVANDNFDVFLRYSKSVIAFKQFRDEFNLKVNMQKIIGEIQLRPWQIEMQKRLLEQNDRKILWIVDSKGGRGKTTFAKYLVAYHDAYYVQNGKSADIMYSYNDQPIVCLDYTRDFESYVNYSILETFKNGIGFSPKYESRTRIFKPCKVVIFSNFLPNLEKLSNDRWDIQDLVDYK